MSFDKKLFLSLSRAPVKSLLHREFGKNIIKGWLGDWWNHNIFHQKNYLALGSAGKSSKLKEWNFFKFSRFGYNLSKFLAIERMREAQS